MVQMVHLRMIDREGREKIIVMEMAHVRRRGRSGGQIGAVETVHVKDEEGRRGQICEVERGRGWPGSWNQG